MKFLNALFWEFVQNVPVIVLFVAGVWLWARQRRRAAMAVMVVGGTIGAFIIRFTEPLINGYHEPWGTTAINIVGFALLQILFASYLGTEARWSNWRTDVLLGVLGGAALALAQGVTARGSPLIGIVLHSVALGGTGAFMVVSIRRLRDRSLRTALVGAAVAAFLMTLLIGVIDYSYLLLVR